MSSVPERSESTRMTSVDIEELAALSRAFARAAASVVGMAELEGILRELVSTATQATEARYGALGVVGRDGRLERFVHVGMDDDLVEAIGALPTGRGVLGTLIRDATPLRLDDLSKHPDSTGVPPHHPPMRTFLGVPVRSGDSVYGNLYLTEAPEGFTELDELFVSALAEIAGSAIQVAGEHDGSRLFAVAEDRSRIGRQLHDTIVQELFAIGVEIQAVSATSDPATGQRLAPAVRQIDDAIEELRHIVSDFHPVDDSESTLVIQEALNDLSDAHGIPVGLSVRPVNLRLDQDVVGEVRAFVVEAVSNALRHSGSDFVDVELELTDGRLEVSVVDGGVGFTPGGVVPGFGLGNLAEIAERIGGHFAIRSAPAEGTTVNLSVDIGA